MTASAPNQSAAAATGEQIQTKGPHRVPLTAPVVAAAVLIPSFAVILAAIFPENLVAILVAATLTTFGPNFTASKIPTLLPYIFMF